MNPGRQIVDYALQRRALLSDVHTGRRSLTDACDAHPYLRLAAQHYGHEVDNRCPVCDHRALRHVHYAYGDALGKSSGQAKSLAELERMQDQFDEFDVYVVEICLNCNWNHLIRTYVLGGASGLPTAADG